MELSFEMRGAGEQPRVLVVESNRNYVGVLARRLSGFGYRVATADGAQAALGELYRMPVDLVIADANLPGTSGTELARMIRDDPVHQRMPLMLVVGRSDSASAVRAFEAGADGIIRKPCHFEVLGAAIARQLQNAKAMKRLVNDNAALDAKVISRVIELRELREQLITAQAEQRRLAAIVEGRAA